MKQLNNKGQSENNSMFKLNSALFENKITNKTHVKTIN